nr:immunoglobulin heavy chain junction region [Mus musculus]
CARFISVVATDYW